MILFKIFGQKIEYDGYLNVHFIFFPISFFTFRTFTHLIVSFLYPSHFFPFLYLSNFHPFNCLSFISFTNFFSFPSSISLRSLHFSGFSIFRIFIIAVLLIRRQSFKGNCWVIMASKISLYLSYSRVIIIIFFYQYSSAILYLSVFQLCFLSVPFALSILFVYQ